MRGALFGRLQGYVADGAARHFDVGDVSGAGI